MDEIIRDAFGDVGLVQRLAEQVCLAAKVYETQGNKATVGGHGELTQARATVSSKMRARYDAFADDFVRGMKRMTEGLEVYKHMLRAFTKSTNEELLEGI